MPRPGLPHRLHRPNSERTAIVSAASSSGFTAPTRPRSPAFVALRISWWASSLAWAGRARGTRPSWIFARWHQLRSPSLQTRPVSRRDGDPDHFGVNPLQPCGIVTRLSTSTPVRPLVPRAGTHIACPRGRHRRFPLQLKFVSGLPDRCTSGAAGSTSWAFTLRRAFRRRASFDRFSSRPEPFLRHVLGSTSRPTFARLLGRRSRATEDDFATPLLVDTPCPGRQRTAWSTAATPLASRVRDAAAQLPTPCVGLCGVARRRPEISGCAAPTTACSLSAQRTGLSPC